MGAAQDATRFSTATTRRPMYAPLAHVANAKADRSGIIAFGYVESDDGRSALVELVALDQAAFAPLLADKNPDIKVFAKGKDKHADALAEFGKLKHSFDADSFRVNVP